MMARTHVLMGAAVWSSTTLGYTIGTPVELVAGAVVAGGSALLPDLDHRVGTASKTWGPITRLLGQVVGRACGGHRAGTHTILAAVAAGALVYAALATSPWLAVPVLALIVGLAMVAWESLIPGRWERVWPINLLVSLAAAWALVASGVVLAGGGGGWMGGARRRGCRDNGGCAAVDARVGSSSAADPATHRGQGRRVPVGGGGAVGVQCGCCGAAGSRDTVGDRGGGDPS
jgi:membrane-bound metal-dependent hydrolase YbcI (DUF457 family)